MNLVKIEGIVINKKDINDFDRIITVFTRNYGKISVLLKGIRKSKRRDKIGADVLAYTKIVAYKKENSYTGSSVECVKSYENIRQDIDKISVVLYIFHVLNNILMDSVRDVNTYELTIKSIDYIEKEKNSMNYTILLVYYLYKIIIWEGLKFELNKGRNFSISSSMTSDEISSNSIKINDEEYKIIEMLYLGKVRKLLQEGAKMKDLYSVLQLYEKYLNYHMEIQLNLKNYILEA